ncbi:hypothetical protein F5883DRAFT_579907 [Diaporthe sp. PMI_573]|nr:hypothetical protein F5883DRAFT_579907 [Diaporthaceae sp. PMI_573]
MSLTFAFSRPVHCLILCFSSRIYSYDLLGRSFHAHHAFPSIICASSQAIPGFSVLQANCFNPTKSSISVAN